MPNHSLNISIPRQAQSNWCWAAVAEVIDTFYAGAAQHRQCHIVNGVLQRNDCCVVPGSVRCDVPASLEDALKHISRWAGTHSFAQTWTHVDMELGKGRPVGVLVKLIGGGGHFVTITGNGTQANQVLTVDDPHQGRTTTTHAMLAKSFHGVWAATYDTRP